LKGLICQAFELTRAELAEELLGGPVKKEKEGPSAQEIEDELWRMIPNGGYCYRYAEFTRHSEAPLAYHLFCSLVGVGATINRRVWFEMGYFRIFCNLSIVLIGPSGLKKTTASDIVVGMLQELELTKIYSEKLTPEALIEAMRDMAQGLVYAPEMSVFLGKARYMEGIIPLITRFMDCPSKWSSGTIMRSTTFLTDVAISCLMCTTPDWFVSNTPADTFGGGFVARNILVVQEDSPRVEPIPRPGDPKLRGQLIADLGFLHSFEGEMVMEHRCDKAYRQWYVEQKEVWKNPESEIMATYYQRKPGHVIRIAMCLHIAEHRTLMMCEGCFMRAVKIVDWTEKFLPPMLKKMFKTQAGAEQELVLRTIRSVGGVIDHSDLLRKVQYQMNAGQLRSILMSLKDAKQIEERKDNLQHIYIQVGGNQ